MTTGWRRAAQTLFFPLRTSGSSWRSPSSRMHPVCPGWARVFLAASRFDTKQRSVQSKHSITHGNINSLVPVHNWFLLGFYWVCDECETCDTCWMLSSLAHFRIVIHKRCFGQICLQDKSVEQKDTALVIAGKLEKFKLSRHVCISKSFRQTRVCYQYWWGNHNGTRKCKQSSNRVDIKVQEYNEIWNEWNQWIPKPGLIFESAITEFILYYGVWYLLCIPSYSL